MFAFAKREATSLFAAIFYCPVLGRCFLGRCFLGDCLFGGWRIGLLRIPRGLRLRGLEITHRLLQRGEIHLQRFDLTVSRIEFLLMVERQLHYCLLKKLDIALQTTGAPLHRLFDGADFDTGNVLRMHSAGTEHDQRHSAYADSKPADHRKPRFNQCLQHMSRGKLVASSFSWLKATTLRPQSRIELDRRDGNGTWRI